MRDLAGRASRALCATGLLAALALAPSLSLAQEIVLKTGTSWNKNFPMAEMLSLLDSRMKAHSEGRLGMEIHLANSLCSEKTCVEQVELGQTDIGTASVSNYGGFYRTYEVLTLPYIFSDEAAAQSVLEGFLFDELETVSVEKDGIRVLAVVPFLGFRQLETAEGPVKSPADLRGKKVRVTKSPLDGALIRAWGAVATPVAWAETYDALQQNVVSGLYIQKPVHAMMKFYEVTPYVTMTGGAWTPMIIFMDQDRYAALPDWAQKAVDQAAADLRGQVFQIDQTYADKLGAANAEDITYYTPTEAEMAEWRAAAARSWAVGKQLKLYDPAMARRILETQEGTAAFIEQLEKQGSL
ncbi:MAG: hypothetical protein Kilf2KO_22200 [Rhodospirillales bacterium]